MTKKNEINPNKGLYIHQIGKSYYNKSVLKNINIQLMTGEVVGLLGPNGAGKTTCFYIISGLVRPDYGKIYLNGTDMTVLPMYRRARLGLGYLPQEPSIFRGMTVEQNLMAAIELSTTDIDKRTILLNDLLAEFSISHLRTVQAISLSGGERRRLEIARCLASNPSYILLDEPLAGIDPISISDVKTLICHLKSRKIGILITDHNVREALEIVDRAYIIYNGIVLMEGSPQQIVSNKQVRQVYLGEGFTLKPDI